MISCLLTLLLTFVTVNALLAVIAVFWPYWWAMIPGGILAVALGFPVFYGWCHLLRPVFRLEKWYKQQKLISRFSHPGIRAACLAFREEHENSIVYCNLKHEESRDIVYVFYSKMCRPLPYRIYAVDTATQAATRLEDPHYYLKNRR